MTCARCGTISAPAASADPRLRVGGLGRADARRSGKFLPSPMRSLRGTERAERRHRAVPQYVCEGGLRGLVLGLLRTRSFTCARAWVLGRPTRKYLRMNSRSRPWSGAPHRRHTIWGSGGGSAPARTTLYSAPQFGHQSGGLFLAFRDYSRSQPSKAVPLNLRGNAKEEKCLDRQGAVEARVRP